MNVNLEIFTGQRFGKWTVTEGEKTHISPSGQHVRYVKCKCDCGNEKYVALGELKRGKSTMCRTCSHKVIGEKNKTHGLCRTGVGIKIVDVWRQMIKRCESTSNSAYKHYGGRGICVCDEWHDVSIFHKWAIENGYKEGLSIDRINNDGNYEPSNCRWTNASTQAKNTRLTHKYTYNGETLCMTDWGRKIGGNAATILNRVNAYGWSYEKAITTPLRKRGFCFMKKVSQFTQNGLLVKTYESMQEAAIFNGISTSSISKCCNGKLKCCKGYVWKFV